MKRKRKSRLIRNKQMIRKTSKRRGREEEKWDEN
jgi:hypothetical protein